jgi:Cupredoxin-like domain
LRSAAVRLAIFLVALLTVVLSAVLLRAEPGPYVVTAIDYHFHDAHPTRPLVSGEDFIVENQGRNVHNVTIPALGFSQDVAPGGRVVIPSIADRLEPGRYQLYCRIHLEEFGMKGVIVIAAE